MKLISGFKSKIGSLFSAGSQNVAAPVPGYTASSLSKTSMINWSPPLTSANTEVSKYENQTLVARGYDAYRNNSVARAAITQIKTNVINGLRANPDIDADYLGLTEEQEDELEAAIEREFDIFCQTCDAEKTHDLEENAILALTSWLITGDGFVNTFFEDNPGDFYSLKLQVIDSERICNEIGEVDTKNLKKGVVLDNVGAPKAYKVRGAHPADSLTEPEETMKWETVDAFDEMGRRRFLHLFEKERPGQVRGVSFLAPILEPLKQLDRYSEAELMAAVVSSYLTFFIETPTDSDGMSNGFEPRSTDENSEANSQFELGPAAAIELANGKKVTAHNPGRPNANYESFFNAMCRGIGASLGLPVDEILLMFNSSYSASRAAMLKAWKLYTQKRNKVIKMILAPVYSLWFDEAVYRGVLPHIKDYWNNPRRRMAYQRHNWLSSGRGAIDELKEAQASRERYQNNLSDLPTEIANLTGRNYKNVLRQQSKAERFMKKVGVIAPEKDQKTSNEPTIDDDETETTTRTI